MTVTRTFDFLQRYKENFPDKDDALAGKVKGEWVKYSSKDYIENANNISYGLKELGYKAGDKISTVCNNRPEWNFVDMGLAQLGIVHVPIFTTIDQDGYKDILTHSKTKCVFVSDKALVDKITPLVNVVETLEKVYAFDEVEGVSSWKEVLDLGAANADKHAAEVEEIKKGINENDCVTLIYTSGTTATPKGVMLSHKNLVSNAKAAAAVFKLQSNHRYLGILPICHVGERMGNYQTQYSGCSIYYAENIGTIANDLKDIKPHGFGAVPRILEKVYDKIINKGEKLTGIKKKLFFWALDLGLKYEIDGKNGAWYNFKLKIANKIIFSKWREAMGGNVISIGVGGAALQPRLERVFWSAGIKLLNMYGLTETSPIITINRASSPLVQLGSVGAGIEGVEIKIAEDGEILCKGDNVMIGYYDNEKATSEAIDKEGWFHTGDIGHLDQGKFLRITDRKKEIFKLTNGKYVSPQAVENGFKESIFVDQIMAIGAGEKFSSAIITPNFEALNHWCKENGIDTSDKKAMVKDEKVIAHYTAIVKKINPSLTKDERISNQLLMADEWTPESGDLSPTLKLKRRVLREKYKAEIQQIYGRELESSVAQ
ncbi:MAG: long-chain fatty acid--CoA ligase [Crocinitomicaceae bacterium]|nr:long-chain fatty acid--CoA ligase [Crocinitomicaceae bacterium]